MTCRDCSHDGTCGGACARRIAWLKHWRETEKARRWIDSLPIDETPTPVAKGDE